MSRRSQRASFAEADIALEQTLSELDENVPNYNEWLRTLIAPAARGTVLELGAGLGTFSRSLLRTADRVVAVEPSERGCTALREATADEPRILAIHGYALDAKPESPFDGAVMSNVLEHIEDDEETLRQIASMMAPGGLVAVFSPAFQMLMSDFDRSIGHVRRYRKRELQQTFVRAGYSIVTARYVNMPGFFAWLLVSRLLRKRPTDSGLSRWYDRRIVPIARAVESKVSPPFGQSVLVIGRVNPSS
jgi:SAM-dependent methyltransferase